MNPETFRKMTPKQRNEYLFLFGLTEGYNVFTPLALWLFGIMITIMLINSIMLWIYHKQLTNTAILWTVIRALLNWMKMMSALYFSYVVYIMLKAIRHITVKKRWLKENKIEMTFMERLRD